MGTESSKALQSGLQYLFDASPVVIFLKDIEGRYVLVNERYLKVFGRVREEVIGRCDEDMYSPCQALQFRDNDRQVLTTGTSMDFEEVADYHGVPHTSLVSKFPLRDADDNVIGVGGIGIDITDRKLLESLRLREERFALAALGADIAIWDRDLRAGTVFASEKLRQIVGVNENVAALPFEEWLNRIHHADRERVLAAVTAHLDQRSARFDEQYRIRHEDGSYRWVSSRGQAQRDAAGAAYRVVGTIFDVTEQKAIEERERSQQQLLSVIAQAQSQYVADHDASAALERLLTSVLSLTASEFGFIGEICHTALRAPYLQCHAISQFALAKVSSASWPKWEFHDLDTPMGEVIRTCAPVLKNSWAGATSGDVLPGASHMATFLGLPFLKGRELIGMVGLANRPSGYDEAMIADLSPLTATCASLIEAMRVESSRRQAELALRDSEQRYRSLVELSPDGIYVQQDYLILFANPASVRILGAKREEDLLGLSTFEFLDRDFQSAARARTDRILQEGWAAPPTETRITRLDGTVLDVEISGSRVMHGEAFAVQTIVRDISERKRMENWKFRSQRLESLGTLAGGCAHDFNNVLSAIYVNAELAASELSPTTVAHNHLQEILKASQRAGAVVSQMLRMARPSSGERKTLHLSTVIEEAMRLLRPVLPKHVTLDIDCHDNTPSTSMDSDQLHQIIVNLVTNAAHAIGTTEGCIRIQTQGVTFDDQINAPPGLPPGTYARLRVSDNGHGMDPGTQERIFDPFFTTKPPGKGVGLGLSIVHEIMRSVHGTIEVHSKVGHGATFDLYFASEQIEKPRSPTIPMPSKAVRVLFVDDDRLVSFATCRSLQVLGYTVTTAYDAQQALRELSLRSSEFDVLILDLTMPGMSGLELAECVRVNFPYLPIILSSGHIVPANREWASKLGIHELLHKPYGEATLRDSIARALVQQTNSSQG